MLSLPEDWDYTLAGVVEQMPFKVPPGTKLITEMAPTKSNDRILPITEETLPYFLRQFDLIERQRELIAASGGIDCPRTSDSLSVTLKCRTFVSTIYATPRQPICTSSQATFTQ